jgi:hypothetical protein
LDPPGPLPGPVAKGLRLLRTRAESCSIEACLRPASAAADLRPSELSTRFTAWDRDATCSAAVFPPAGGVRAGTASLRQLPLRTRATGTMHDVLPPPALDRHSGRGAAQGFLRKPSAAAASVSCWVPRGTVDRVALTAVARHRTIPGPGARARRLSHHNTVFAEVFLCAARMFGAFAHNFARVSGCPRLRSGCAGVMLPDHRQVRDWPRTGQRKKKKKRGREELKKK